MEDSEDLFGRNTIGRVRSNMLEHDLAVPVDDDVGAQLQSVVTGRPAEALACDERPHTRRDDARAQEPERRRAACPERLVERAVRVGDDESPPEGKLITPGRSSSSSLWGDDDQPGACILDLGNSLHDTAKVGTTDVSAGVPREIHDGRMPEEVAVGHDLPFGVLELEGRERLYPEIMPVNST